METRDRIHAERVCAGQERVPGADRLAPQRYERHSDPKKGRFPDPGGRGRDTGVPSSNHGDWRAPCWPRVERISSRSPPKFTRETVDALRARLRCTSCRRGANGSRPGGRAQKRVCRGTDSSPSQRPEPFSCFREAGSFAEDCESSSLPAGTRRLGVLHVGAVTRKSARRRTSTPAISASAMRKDDDIRHPITRR